MWRCALILLAANPAWGCMCSGWSTAKQALQSAPVVIYGTVTFADPEVGVMFHAQVARVQVDEAFKGAVVGQVFELHPGGSDCDAKFSKGQRVLLHLYPGQEKGIWGVSPCVDAGGDKGLAFLRGLPRSAQGTRLSGEVELYEESARHPFQRVKGLSGIHVRISGDDGSQSEAVTNDDGVYEVYGRKPGRYTMSIDPPKGLRLKFPVANPQTPGGGSMVDLAPNGDASVSFVLEADTRISGHVLDSRGRPVPHVCMNLMDKEGRGERDTFFFECSKEGDAGFKFEMMPPGEYRIIAHDDIKVDRWKSRSTLYVPGVRDREQGQIIKVEAGKYVSGLELRIPANEKRYEFSGQAEYADGVPLSGTVTFSSEPSGYTERIEIREDGSFALPVVAGMEGELFADTSIILNILPSCPQFVAFRETGMFAHSETARLAFTSVSDQKNLKLVMPFASCKGPARR
jgi:hypothetical protein